MWPVGECVGVLLAAQAEQSLTAGPVVVTGSTGFVGGSLARRLGPRAVKVSLRNFDPRHMSLPALGQDFCVVHLAGLAHQHGTEAEYHEVNVNQTLALADWANKRQARRFIFFSSAKALGEKSRKDQPLRPEDPPHPQDAYGRSKREAEEKLRANFCDSPMKIVIIRAPLIYGPGVKGNFRTLMKLLDKQIPLPLNAWSQNLRSFAGLTNVVSLIERCVDHPEAGGRIFHASDGEDISTAELIFRLAHAMGVPVRSMPVPEWLVGIGLRWAGKGDLQQKLAGNLQLDITQTRHLLNWNPPTSMGEELARMVRFFQAS